MTAGLQVNLSVGTNTVKVKVTAPDTTTTETYTVNVLRVAVPATCSVASMQNQVWTANLTVGTRMIPGTTTIFYGWGDTLSYTGASLTDDEFTFGGDTYEIDEIYVPTPGGLTLVFDSTNTGDIATQATRNTLTLHVGSDSFNLGAGTLASNQRTISWSNTGLSWANGESVCLALTVAAPDVSSVEITSVSVDGTNGIGDAIEATVTFSAAVDITGTPQLELDFAGTPKPANCTAATNPTTMVCSYTVAVAIDANHKVDGSRPTLVTTGAEAPTTSTDGTQVILTFSETLSSVDRTKITIGIGGGQRRANERGESGGHQGRTRSQHRDRRHRDAHRGARPRRSHRRRLQRQPRRGSDPRDQRDHRQRAAGLLLADGHARGAREHGGEHEHRHGAAGGDGCGQRPADLHPGGRRRGIVRLRPGDPAALDGVRRHLRPRDPVELCRDAEGRRRQRRQRHHRGDDHAHQRHRAAGPACGPLGVPGRRQAPPACR